jgi:hypothetical protein
MRLIGTLEDERKAQAFSQFLSQKGIANHIEIEKETNWDSPSYGTSQCHIWIEEEDHLEEVSKWFHLFINHPQDPIFQTAASIPYSMQSGRQPMPLSSPPPQPSESQTSSSWGKQPMGWITKSLLALCCFLFFLSQLTMPSVQVPERYAGLILFTSPV